jgi:glycosyltransferase involved in cell wall biosynthesis
MTSRARRVWLVQTGEEMPDDKGPPRLLRTALLAKELVARGHDVTFWNSTFSHQQKVQRFAESTMTRSIDGYAVQYLKARAYSENISIARILSHIGAAREFRRLAPNLARPDVIISGLPTLEVCAEVADYAKPRGVPFVIDCRDMWPDIISERLTGVKALLGWPAMAWWRSLKRRSLSQASGITGVTSMFVDWGLEASGRPLGPLDRAFHLAVPASKPSTAELEVARRSWDSVIGAPEPGTTVACYMSSFSTRHDIPAFIEGLRRLDADTRKRFKMVICGKGDLESYIKKRCEEMPHVFFAGWRGAADISALMERSAFGVLPYALTQDYRSHFVNKVGEYLSGGLPIMTGLDGMTGEMLEREGLGIAYEVGNPDSVARAIEKAVRNQRGIDAMKDKAKSVYRQMFDPEKIYSAFADYVEEIASGAAVRPAAFK